MLKTTLVVGFCIINLSAKQFDTFESIEQLPSSVFEGEKPFINMKII